MSAQTVIDYYLSPVSPWTYLAASRFREPHGDVGCEVPVRGIAGALDRAFGGEVSRRIGEVRQAAQGVVEEFCYRGFHGAGAYAPGASMG